jgi:hypothetical protein
MGDEGKVVLSEGERLGEIGNGKRVAIVVSALLVVAALIVVMVVGFRGRHVSRNAAALTAPIVVSPPPAAPGSVVHTPPP